MRRRIGQDSKEAFVDASLLPVVPAILPFPLLVAAIVALPSLAVTPVFAMLTALTALLLGVATGLRHWEAVPGGAGRGRMGPNRLALQGIHP